MARIMVGSWMVRYPLGGNLSWALQWLVGLQRLGHDVYVVEKAGGEQDCFDPSLGDMTDDAGFGLQAVNSLLSRFDLASKWCFVDFAGEYHGISRSRIESLFATADVYLDIGSHGAWLEEAKDTPITIRVDGEPGYTQIKWEKIRQEGGTLPAYSVYCSNGPNIGTAHSPAPTCGVEWRPLYSPVVTDLFECSPSRPDAAFTTVMNWQSHAPLDYQNVRYGQKDVEFVRFSDLPGRAAAPLEVAVSGNSVPRAALAEERWSLADAHEVTATYDSFVQYIRDSRGEFSVCKQGYVALNTGWFSDKSAAFLASGRPVVLQDTGFSRHLPCGRGLFAVRNVEEAAEAIRQIEMDPALHQRCARDIAREFLDARVLLGGLLRDLGVTS